MLGQCVCLFNMQPSEFWQLNYREYYQIYRYYMKLKTSRDVDEGDAQEELANDIAINGAYR